MTKTERWALRIILALLLWGFSCGVGSIIHHFMKKEWPVSVALIGLFLLCFLFSTLVTMKYAPEIVWEEQEDE